MAASVEEFTRYLHDNVRSTQRVFEAAVEAGVRRVVYASSSSVYGNAEVYPCGEATPLSLARRTVSPRRRARIWRDRSPRRSGDGRAPVLHGLRSPPTT
ncbi:MAG: NAD-dependent epimerase/dehydratase family protein [Acidimicrobiales bacterium]